MRTRLDFNRLESLVGWAKARSSKSAVADFDTFLSAKVGQARLWCAVPTRLLVGTLRFAHPCMGAIVKNLCVVLRVFPSFWFGQFLCSTLVWGPLSRTSVLYSVSSPPFGLVSFFVRPLYWGLCQYPLCFPSCLPLLLVWSVSLFDPCMGAIVKNLCVVLRVFPSFWFGQ